VRTPPDRNVGIEHILYSRYWTGTSLQWRLMRGNIIKNATKEFNPH